MSIADASQMLAYMITLCAPTALLINLVQFGVNALLSALTGRGLKLNGK